MTRGAHRVAHRRGDGRSAGPVSWSPGDSPLHAAASPNGGHPLTARGQGGLFRSVSDPGPSMPTGGHDGSLDALDGVGGRRRPSDDRIPPVVRRWAGRARALGDTAPAGHLGARRRPRSVWCRSRRPGGVRGRSGRRGIGRARRGPAPGGTGSLGIRRHRRSLDRAPPWTADGRRRSWGPIRPVDGAGAVPARRCADRRLRAGQRWCRSRARRIPRSHRGAGIDRRRRRRPWRSRRSRRRGRRPRRASAVGVAVAVAPRH